MSHNSEHTQVNLDEAKHTRIGVVSQGIDGSDVYDRFDFPEAVTAEHALTLAKRMHYREGTGPGSAFCTFFQVMPMQYSTGFSWITVSALRYDI